MATKKISDLQLRSDFDDTCLIPVDDASQTWRVTGAQVRTFIKANTAPLTTLGDTLYAGAAGAPARLAGVTAALKSFLTQTGTGSVSAIPVWQTIKTPTVQRFTTGSGTYTTPAGTLYLKVRLVGGGGGGSGSGNSGCGPGGNGTATTFGSSLLTASFGIGAAGGTTPYDSGPGGAPTVNSPALAVLSIAGSRGLVGSSRSIGGSGGMSFLTGNGTGGVDGGGGGSAALANSGSGGGGGGGSNTPVLSGSGGGAGAFIESYIPTPGATYAYAIGSGGAAGTAGSTGVGGGAGGSGFIEVTEYYQ